MVLPNMPGANPRLLIAAGKAGNMYLLDATRIHQVNRLATYPIGPCWCGPSFYQGADGVYRVVSSGGSSVIIWDLATSDSAPAALTQERAVPITSGQDGGFFTSVSSNGVQPGTAINLGGRPADQHSGRPDPVRDRPGQRRHPAADAGRKLGRRRQQREYRSDRFERPRLCRQQRAAANLRPAGRRGDGCRSLPGRDSQRGRAGDRPHASDTGRTYRHRLDQANGAGLADHRNPHRTVCAG